MRVPAILRLLACTLLFPLVLPAQDSAATRPARRGLPLEATRNWTLNTTEGSWLSVDVSPDGRTLVFDMLGDLYTMPIGGGTATALTSGMPFDAQPRFSPDGKHIVYVSDEDGGDNLWLLEVASGKKTQLTRGKTNRYVSPTWTPDGQYLVAARAPFRGGTTVASTIATAAAARSRSRPRATPPRRRIPAPRSPATDATCGSPNATVPGTTTRTPRSTSSCATTARRVAR